MKILSCLAFACILYLQLPAQHLHLNTYIGTANYYGDLQSKRFTFDQSKLAVGVGLSYEVNDNFFIRTGAMFAKVAADDKKNPQTSIRNLNFTTSITEGHLVGEYYLKNLYESAISPYIFVGIAVYHFNPYTTDTAGTKFFLQPLSTEGQGFYQDRKPYKLTQFAIPFGGGLKIALSENVRMGIEFGMRKLFTDYLDDVSSTYVDPNLLLINRGPKAVELAFRSNELKTGLPSVPVGDNRGGAKFKDWYYFTAFTTSFRIGGGGGIGNRYKTGCPTRVY